MGDREKKAEVGGSDWEATTLVAEACHELEPLGSPGEVMEDDFEVRHGFCLVEQFAQLAGVGCKHPLHHVIEKDPALNS